MNSDVRITGQRRPDRGTIAGSLLRALLRLRHDFVMIGRATVLPFSETLQVRLEVPLARAFETSADYLRGSSAALIERRNPPPLYAVDTDFDGYEAEIAALRHEGLTRDLPGDAVERFFALVLLSASCTAISGTSNSVREYARSTIGTGRRRAN